MCDLSFWCNSEHNIKEEEEAHENNARCAPAWNGQKQYASISFEWRYWHCHYYHAVVDNVVFFTLSQCWSTTLLSWECAALSFSERTWSYCCWIRVDNDGWINKETALSSFDGPLFDDFCHTKLLVAPCLCRLASSWMMVLPPFLFWTLAGGPFDSFSWVLLRHSMENQDSGYHFGSFVFSFFLRSCRLFFVWSFLDSGWFFKIRKKCIIEFLALTRTSGFHQNQAPQGVFCYQ